MMVYIIKINNIIIIIIEEEEEKNIQGITTYTTFVVSSSYGIISIN